MARELKVSKEQIIELCAINELQTKKAKKEKKEKKTRGDKSDTFDVVTLAKSYTAMQELWVVPHTSNLFDALLEPPPFHYDDAKRRYPTTDNNDFDQLLAGVRADWYHLAPLEKYPAMKSYELFQAHVRHSHHRLCNSR